MTAALPTRPHGSVDTSSLNWDSGYGAAVDWLLDYVPDLSWPLSIRTYSRMRYDPQLKAVLSAYTLPIRRADWLLDGDGCDPAVTAAVADQLDLPVKGVKQTPTGARRRGMQWAPHLRMALLKLVYGHMAFSRWYDMTGHQATIAGVQERMPYSIDAIHVDQSGNIDYIDQGVQPGSPANSSKIAANELVWYAHEREGTNWTGQSLLRSSYTAWLLKHEMWRVHATSNRRFGMGVPVVHAPLGGTPQQVTEATRLASGMRVGDTSGAGLPNGFDFKLEGLTGSVPDTLAFIQYLDKQMTRATLTSLLDMSDTTHGSRALGETFMDLFLLALQTIGDETASDATTQLVVPLVDANYGEDAPAPRIVCGDVGSEHEVTATTIQLLMSSGAIQPDESIDAYLRGQYKLPERVGPWSPPPSHRPVSDPLAAHPSDNTTPSVLPGDNTPPAAAVTA